MVFKFKKDKVEEIKPVAKPLPAPEPFIEEPTEESEAQEEVKEEEQPQVIEAPVFFSPQDFNRMTYEGWVMNKRILELLNVLVESVTEEVKK